ncbi:GNAT family N-acetyltransferase [Massilia glaciei]|uniref:N-acetyltransferase n=1 Tax=Massilia glaciei TaxID=1524097 RepID=A0A2U2HG81_9BURK|nr:GNAT family N-acetyltransferase [Massilia glaciei]PWF43935.1 N-acetyltransferase [Massilia glaciei]
MPSFVHRNARQEDLARIVHIYNSTVASREVTADTEPVSAASRQQWFDEHTPGRRPLWVIHAADDDSAAPAVLGWMSYSNFYGRPAYSGTAELSIYIDEASRGKGIGCYCLEQAIAFAPEIAVHTLLGFIFGHNAPSLGLFARFGFESWAKLPRVANLDGIERDLIILGKRVG